MLKYIGGGRFIPGVPARDLQENELAHYNKKRLLESGLYVEVRPQISRSRKRSDSESEED